jgi:hypothetical protein
MAPVLEIDGLDALDSLESRMRAVSMSSFEDLLRRAEGLVQSFAPRDTGTFADSITHEQSGAWPILEGEVFSTLRNDALVNTIEDGRRPGAPPPPITGESGAQLEAWAGRHGFEDPHGSLFALARSIGRKGTPAFAPFQKTHDVIESELPGMLDFITARVAGGGA